MVKQSSVSTLVELETSSQKKEKDVSKSDGSDSSDTAEEMVSTESFTYSEAVEDSCYVVGGELFILSM